MPQSLTRLPQTADFEIDGTTIKIKEHRIVIHSSLFKAIIAIARNGNPNSDVLAEFEKHGISYETVIEERAET